MNKKKNNKKRIKEVLCRDKERQGGEGRAGRRRSNTVG
jgi:hypothetical protein